MSPEPKASKKATSTRDSLSLVQANEATQAIGKHPVLPGSKHFVFAPKESNGEAAKSIRPGRATTKALADPRLYFGVPLDADVSHRVKQVDTEGMLEFGEYCSAYSDGNEDLASGEDRDNGRGESTRDMERAQGSNEDYTEDEPKKYESAVLRRSTRKALEVASNAISAGFNSDVAHEGDNVSMILSTRTESGCTSENGITNDDGPGIDLNSRSVDGTSEDDAPTDGVVVADVSTDEGSEEDLSQGNERDADNSVASSQVAINTMESQYVDQEVTRLKDAIPDWEHLYFAEAPCSTGRENVPRLQSTLIEEYCPQDGKFWRGGLVHWLRSGAALPIIKLWHSACVENNDMFALLKTFLPANEYPWTSQLQEIVDLAKLPDSGRSQDAPEVVLLCAIYARKLFLCNHMRLLENGIISADFVWHRILDIPCAALFTVYHDLITAPASGRTFFSVLLNSPLALPMHANIRAIVEKDYPLPTAYPHPLDAANFFTAAEGSKPDGSMPPPPPPHGINHSASYEHDPFSEEEPLLFWIAYQDVTEKSELFGIDCAYIAELLPGRCDDEVAAFYKLNKVNLGLEDEGRVVIARTGGEDDGEGGASTDDSISNADTPDQPTTTDESAGEAPLTSTRPIANLQIYVAPPPPALHPPQPRQTLPPLLRAHMYAVDAAQKACNEAELALAGWQADLEDAMAEGVEGSVDSLRVQVAWYERDEAVGVLRERQRDLGRAWRELRMVRMSGEGAGDGEDVDGGNAVLVCDDEEMADFADTEGAVDVVLET